MKLMSLWSFSTQNMPAKRLWLAKFVTHQAEKIGLWRHCTNVLGPYRLLGGGVRGRVLMSPAIASVVQYYLVKYKG